MTSEKMPRSVRSRVTSLVNHSRDRHFRTLHAIFHIFSKISGVMSTHVVQASCCWLPIPPRHIIFLILVLCLGSGYPTLPFLSFLVSLYPSLLELLEISHGIPRAIYKWENKANPTPLFHANFDFFLCYIDSNKWKRLGQFSENV